MTVEFEPPTGPVLLLFTRNAGSTESTWQAWINGKLPESGAISNGVNSGTGGPLTVGSRITGGGGTTWGDGFDGEVSQVAIYGSTITELEASYILHEMARRAMIELGTPIVEDSQPFNGDGANTLNRRPIAVINLSSGGMHQGNFYGQDPEWRASTQGEIRDFLRREIRRILVANDQFEIMFNRPAGSLKQDVVPSYVFGTGPNGQSVITSDQWDAMRDVWDEFNMGPYNDEVPKTSRLTARRRGWFYTGGGLPLTDQGALDTTSLMHNRVIGPATPQVYYDNILEHWQDKDREGKAYFRCLFLDASQRFRGQFVALCHSDVVRENDFILVGEAITRDPQARAAAPCYASLGFSRAPWWKVNPLSGLPDKSLGYRAEWSTDWEDQPIYFGVFRGSYPYMHPRPPDPPPEWTPGVGDNLDIGKIYQFIRKGACPAAYQNATIYRRVGAAWDYAMNRFVPSRQFRSPRLCRGARV